MNVHRIIGSPGVRVAFVAFALLSAVAFVAPGPLAPSGWLRFTAVLFAVLAALAGIHSFQVAYAIWMKFAGVLNKVMTTLVFGLVYLVVVPLFALVMRWIDPLRSRRQKAPGTFWEERSSESVDPDSLSRMV